MELEDYKTAIHKLKKISALASEVLPKLKDYLKEAEILEGIQTNDFEGKLKRIECLRTQFDTQVLIHHLETIIERIGERQISH